MKKFIKLPIFIIFIIIFGAIFALTQRDPQNQGGTVNISLRDYLISSFVNELPDINSKLPLQIDRDTVLLSIEYKSGKVLTRYEIISHQASIDYKQKFAKELGPMLKKQACLDDVKNKLIDADVEFINTYQDSNGLIIFEFPVNKLICSQINSLD